MQVIGIQKDGSFFQLASLSRNGKQIVIDFLETEKGVLASGHLQEKNLPVVTGIDGQDILVRHIKTPLKKKGALHKTLPFQLETLIPYSLDEVVIKPIYLEKQNETLGTFLAVSKKRLENHLEEWSEVDPEWVSCVPMALYRFGCFVSPETPSYIVFHLGHEKTQVVSVIEGAVHSSLTVHLGLDHLLHAYMQDCPQEKEDKRVHAIRQLDLELVSEQDFPHLVEMLSRFRREVDRAFCFLFHKEKEEQPCQILFAGETERSFQIEKWLMSFESFRFDPLDIPSHRGYEAASIKPYAISIGLCLDVLKNDGMSVQFRQENFIAKKTVREAKRSLVKGMLLCLGLACVTFFCTHLLLSKKEAVLHKKLDQYAQYYGSALSSLKGIESKHSLDEKIQLLNKKLKLSKKKYKYFAPPPLVSDLLAYLASHPKLNHKDGDKEMKVTDLHYTLIEYPSIQSPFSPYRIQVDLAFDSPEAKWAREFHDALVDGDNFIDPEEKITWNRSEDHYEITFFFKG